MEYAIFPMKTVNISVRYSENHLGWDLCGNSIKLEDREEFYAPCRVKVIGILSRDTTGYFNTVLFGTCDKDGNKAPVKCEDDVPRVLTFACTHMENDDFKNMNYYIGQIFESGQICYKEGNNGSDVGKSNGNHVHLEVGLDWQETKEGSSLKNTVDNNVILISNTFRILDGFNEIKNSNGYGFKKTNDREDFEIPDVGDKQGICFMKLFNSAARLRDNVVDGTIKTTIPNGTTFEVIGLYSWKAKDGYRWGYGKWNGIEGYFQYDPNVMYPLGKDLSSKNYKMHLFASAARIRENVINGKILTTVPNENNIKIDEFLDGVMADGYQWCKGSFNEIYGYFQYDANVMYPTND